MQLHTASRQKAKLRIGLAGTSGSGKTYSALLLAYGLTGNWRKIALIDTENGSGELYSSLGDYQVLTLTAPFHPSRYITAIETCEAAGVEVIIIDSITHEWSGPGGCLELHDQAVDKMRNPNSFTAWGKITPLHDRFVQAILQSNCHVITTVRSKTEYVLAERNGRQVPQKAGMGQVTRDGFEFELTVSLDLDQEHKAFVSKDRTGLFVDADPQPITAEIGQKLLAWANEGVDDVVDAPTLSQIKEELERTGTDPKALLAYYKAPKLEALTRLKALNCLTQLGRKASKGVNNQETGEEGL